MRFNVGDRVRRNDYTWHGMGLKSGETGTVVRSTHEWTYIEEKGNWKHSTASLGLVTEGEDMPVTTAVRPERTLRVGDRVRIKPNPEHIPASNGCSWAGELMDAYANQEFTLEQKVADNWCWSTWSWAEEWLELVEAGEDIVPKYSVGDKLLYESDTPVEVLKYFPDIAAYEVKSLIAYDYVFSSLERRLSPINEKALAKRLEKAGRS